MASAWDDYPFRDWAAERTNYPRELAEMALAHTIESKVEAAYRRGDLFDKRRRMMDDWSKFCGGVEQRATDLHAIRRRPVASFRLFLLRWRPCWLPLLLIV